MCAVLVGCIIDMPAPAQQGGLLSPERSGVLRPHTPLRLSRPHPLPTPITPTIKVFFYTQAHGTSAAAAPAFVQVADAWVDSLSRKCLHACGCCARSNEHTPISHTLPSFHPQTHTWVTVLHHQSWSLVRLMYVCGLEQLLRCASAATPGPTRFPLSCCLKRARSGGAFRLQMLPATRPRRTGTQGCVQSAGLLGWVGPSVVQQHRRAAACRRSSCGEQCTSQLSAPTATPSIPTPSADRRTLCDCSSWKSVLQSHSKVQQQQGDLSSMMGHHIAIRLLSHTVWAGNKTVIVEPMHSSLLLSVAKLKPKAVKQDEGVALTRGSSAWLACGKPGRFSKT